MYIFDNIYCTTIKKTKFSFIFPFKISYATCTFRSIRGRIGQFFKIIFL